MTEGRGDKIRAIRNNAWALLPLLFWAVYNWIQSIQRMRLYYTPLPIWDYWRAVQYLPRYRAFDLRVLWLQHNEHRIVFPEIIFALDMLFFRGQQIFAIGVSVFCYIGIVAVLGWVLHADRRLTLPIQIAAVLLAAIIVGWQGNALFLADTFLLNWTMSQFAVTAALALLYFAKEPGNTWYLAASLAFAEVATFSAGNGMMLWPVMVLATFGLKLPKRRVWLVAGVGILSIGLYFTAYEFSGSLNLRGMLMHPLYTMEFLGAYLGMPFGGMKAAIFGVKVGLAGLGLAIVLFYIAARRELLDTQAATVFFGLYLFDVLTALLIAAGRMNPSDARFQSAEAIRYLSGPLMNWAVLAVLSIWMAGARGWKMFSPAWVCVLAAFLSLISFPKLRWWLQERNAAFTDRQLVTLAVLNGIDDQNLFLKAFPDANFVHAVIPLIRDGQRLSIFADRHYGLIGKPLLDSFPMQKQKGFGAITFVHPVMRGIEVAGWIDSSRDRENARDIVLVNEAGVVAGFGRKLGDLFPDRQVGAQTPPSLGWVGFVNLDVKFDSIQAFLIRKHQLMGAGEPVRLPAITITTPDHAGKTITGVERTEDPSWTQLGDKQNDDLPSWWLGVRPQGVVYRSPTRLHLIAWTAKDAEKGISLTIRVPETPGHCFVLPILHGPSVDGLSVAVDGMPLSLEERELTWSYLRIPVNTQSTLKLHVTNPDIWLAAGELKQCQ